MDGTEYVCAYVCVVIPRAYTLSHPEMRTCHGQLESETADNRLQRRWEIDEAGRFAVETLVRDRLACLCFLRGP